MVDNPCMNVFVLACIAIIIALVLFGFVVYTNYKHKKRIEELTLYQLHITSNIDSSIPEILDLIIKESFADYQIKNLAYKEEGYITEAGEMEIRKGLTDLVTTRISGAALEKISLFYNMANIADVIADKIYILVMNYVTENNKIYSDDK